MQTELKKQDTLEEIEIELIAKIIDKCFRIQELNISIGPELVNFVTVIEEQIERITYENLEEPYNQGPVKVKTP